MWGRKTSMFNTKTVLSRKRHNHYSLFWHVKNPNKFLRALQNTWPNWHENFFFKSKESSYFYYEQIQPYYTTQKLIFLHGTVCQFEDGVEFCSWKWMIGYLLKCKCTYEGEFLQTYSNKVNLCHQDSKWLQIQSYFISF